MFWWTIFLFSFKAMATPNWGADFRFPPSEYPKLTKENRANILEQDPLNLDLSIKRGAKHTLIYPVTTTELLLPYESLLKFFEARPESKLRRYIYRLAKKATGVRHIEDFFDLIGTVAYPRSPQEYGPNYIPELSEELKTYPLGTSLIETKNGTGLTFSCAACHSADLFGVKVMGLTNRFPRANEFFVMGKKAAKLTNPIQFKFLFGASKEETALIKKSLKAIDYIEAKDPVVLGLDTSLRQTALSLAHRAPDAWATKKKRYVHFPRPNFLRKEVADSKPAVWWNLKYKTRWLSDGSIVSGNPVHTNFLWNEIGRGADLKKLAKWMQESQKVIDDLTSYVFATKAPKYNDFFPGTIDLAKAKKGEKLFLKSCAKCHGVYKKGWSNPNKSRYEDQLATVQVYYHQKTPVINVGTDPYRYQGMKAFSQDLNRLMISKQMNTVVKPQKGYVPPPLVGIWSRWPYFHNNAIPNLCELLTPANKRIKSYIAGPAQNKETDFDQDCVGYPYPEQVPPKWAKNSDYHYDNNKKGMSNSGHSKMLMRKDGTEKFSFTDKKELIEFLKTL